MLRFWRAWAAHLALDFTRESFTSPMKRHMAMHDKLDGLDQKARQVERGVLQLVLILVNQRCNSSGKNVALTDIVYHFLDPNSSIKMARWVFLKGRGVEAVLKKHEMQQINQAHLPYHGGRFFNFHIIIIICCQKECIGWMDGLHLRSSRNVEVSDCGLSQNMSSFCLIYYPS